jgi:hypothetical protein
MSTLAPFEALRCGSRRCRNAPSTGKLTPEMKPADRQSKNSTTAAASSPLPGLPAGQPLSSATRFVGLAHRLDRPAFLG